MASRHWCFTSYEAIDWESLVDEGKVRYVILQREACPETKREHFQGYAEFPKPVRMSGVKALTGNNKIHLEKRRGTREEARDYCRKEESRVDGPWEFGSWEAGGSGARNDLKRCWEDLTNGASWKDLVENHPITFIKHHRGLKAAKFELDTAKYSKEQRDVQVTVYWGETGTGKTRAVYDSHQQGGLYRLCLGSTAVWWDGYNGEETILLDDFYGASSGIKHDTLLQLLDRYPFRLAVKGAHCWAQWKRVYITSNAHPRHWYPIKDSTGAETHEVSPALERRLHTIVYFGLDGVRQQEKPAEG